jgi:outer membrane protein
MKKFIYSMVLFALSASAFQVSAATGTNTPNAGVAVANNNATGEKIGVLDMRQVTEHSVQMAQIRDKLQKEFRPKQEQLIATQTALKTDSERLNRDNAIMNSTDRKQLEQKIVSEEQNLQRMQQTFQQDLVTAQNRELKTFLENIKKVVDKIAQKDNFSLITTKDTVVYVKPGLDVTQKVIQAIPHK